MGLKYKGNVRKKNFKNRSYDSKKFKANAIGYLRFSSKAAS